MHGDLSDMTAEKPRPPSPTGANSEMPLTLHSCLGLSPHLPPLLTPLLVLLEAFSKSLLLRSLAQGLLLEGPPSHSALHRRTCVSPGTVTQHV